MPAAVNESDSSVADLDECIEQLIAASKLSPKNRSQPIQPLISSICTHAFDSGLSSDHLTQLIHLVRSPSTLDQTSITTLIKSLYPSTLVSSSLVHAIVSCIGHGALKPSHATQSLLLRWLVLVQEAFEDVSVLDKCYGVLFNQLSTLAMRQNLCHLLALITKRRHVKPWRIQVLLDILRNSTTEAPLLGLLRVYKEFYPDIVVAQSVGGKPSLFRHPDVEWRDRVRLFQDRNVAVENGQLGQNSAFRVYRKRFAGTRAGVVPEVHTYHTDDKLVSLEEIIGPEDFVQKFERLELPSQMIAILDDPLLQKYVEMRDEPRHRKRIDEWLGLFFDAQLRPMADGQETSKDLGSVLTSLVNYIRYTKTLPPSVEAFVSRLVSVWNGDEYLDLVLELLSFLPLQSFDDLHLTLLQRLEDAILDNGSERLAALLSLYTSLFRNWTTQLLVHPSPPPHALDALAAHSSTLVLQILVTSPTTTAISAVLAHLSTVAYTISLSPTHTYIRILTPSSQTVYLLAFLNPTAATLSPLCSVLATYKLAFEATLTNSALSTPTSTPTTSQPPSQPVPVPPYPRPYVNEFNGFLMDICNLLWRGRAFNSSDQNALGCTMPTGLTRALGGYLDSLGPRTGAQISLPTMFSLSFHPALTGMSITVFRAIEDRAIAAWEQSQSAGTAEGDPDTMDVDTPAAGSTVTGTGQGTPGEVRVRHAGPVSQKSLVALGADGGVRVNWAEYRMEVLKWLDSVGVTGIGELMYCTMKLLMGGKGPRASQGRMSLGSQGTPA